MLRCIDCGFTSPADEFPTRAVITGPDDWHTGPDDWDFETSCPKCGGEAAPPANPIPGVGVDGQELPF